MADKRMCIVQVRLTAAERRDYGQQAERERLNLSTWFRQQAERRLLAARAGQGEAAWYEKKPG